MKIVTINKIVPILLSWGTPEMAIIATYQYACIGEIIINVCTLTVIIASYGWLHS